jgi:Concanavalin A-like lectin/glucanases superfamily
VYDAAARQIRLYVDGELAGASAFTGAWPATGPLQVGRAKHGGVYTDYWPGAVDDVQVYAGVLTQSEIDDLALS